MVEDYAVFELLNPGTEDSYFHNYNNFQEVQ